MFQKDEHLTYSLKSVDGG